MRISPFQLHLGDYASQVTGSASALGLSLSFQTVSGVHSWLPVYFWELDQGLLDEAEDLYLDVVSNLSLGRWRLSCWWPRCLFAWYHYLATFHGWQVCLSQAQHWDTVSSFTDMSALSCPWSPEHFARLVYSLPLAAYASPTRLVSNSWGFRGHHLGMATKPACLL